MTSSAPNVKARHLDGGNLFDDMRIDIAESHQRFANLPRNPQTVRRPRYRNAIRFYLTGIAMRLRVYELLVVNGIIIRWLNDFQGYWTKILSGRPFANTLDFFLLLHDYRKHQQHTTQLEWSDSTQHLANWQHPSQLYATLHNVRKLALRPILALAVWQKISKEMYVLEYGCSMAPYYYCYREFFNHLDCTWVLADIPNFPFHYAKFLYRNCANVEFVTIHADDFSDPLGDTRDFDVIILTTVFEHLDDPLFVFEYLLNRLKTGGLFVFDYIKSEGKGLDHPSALAMRQECVKSILANTQLIYGKIDDINESIGLCIAQKRSA